MDEEMQINHPVYFSRQQAALQSEGFSVIGVISSHMDALSALSVGTRIYKLPNPMYFKYQSSKMEETHKVR